MRVLAFDTATAATTVALMDTEDGGGIEVRDDPAPGERPRHTAKLLPLIAEVLEAAGATWSDLDRLAVGVGPGTFTGLRIGVATARALAQARGLTLVGVSTLQSLALGAAGELSGDGVLEAVIDARRGEAFAAAWPAPAAGAWAWPRAAGRAAPGAAGRAARGALPAEWEPVIAPAAFTPEDLVAATADLALSPLAVGDGAVAFRQALERVGAVIPADDSELHRVSAINHCRLAGREVPTEGEDGLRPEYLRLPDAELARRVAQRT